MQKQPMLNKSQIKSKYRFDDEWIMLLGEPDTRRRHSFGESHFFAESRVTALIESNRDAYEDLLLKTEKNAERRAKKGDARTSLLKKEGLPAHSKHTEDSIARAKNLIAEIKRLFPKIPARTARTIGIFASEPKTGRIACNIDDFGDGVSLAEIAYLAVRSHVRHNMTDYDKVRKFMGNGDEGVTYARAEFWRETVTILEKWGYIEKENQE